MDATSVDRPTTTTDLGQIASDLRPILRNFAQEGDQARRMPQPVLTALSESGLLRLRLPTAFGGIEADNRTTYEVVRAISRGDGAAGWTLAVWAISSWMAGLFPDTVQKTIFGTPSCRVAGILSPGGVAIPTDDGYILNGRWSFNTGAAQSHWNTLAAVIQEDRSEPIPAMVAVRISDLVVDDDWHTSGMRGSGSVTVVANGIPVPDAYVLPIGPVIAGAPPSNSNATVPMYRTPFMVMAGITVGAVAVGLAEAAIDAFLGRLPGRGITYTDHADQSRAGVTHIQVGAASRLLEEARLHVCHAAQFSDERLASEAPWTVEERVRMRLHLGGATRRAREAIDLLASISGGSSTYLHVPIQRIQRDMHTLALHAVMNPETNDELYGRVACGMGPHTLYI
ncbi:acyl-CoA dehydrogenase family protein [Nocardia sp. CNY236]|uniref:acyl-CoA dehydrogenase family protein n=1 Tax=Nocardia sp. CNY236 TaxID=1169152 RepID=UPI000491644C|nr:acyl-CoA dehydrogenase family protein [Nocardia sp. CNY236]